MSGDEDGWAPVREALWAAVGEALTERMAALRMTKAEVIRGSKVSGKTLDGYLAGQPIVRRDKARELCRTLGWTPDSIDRILRGESPAEVDGDAAIAQRIAALEAGFSEVGQALRAVQAAVEAQRSGADA